MADNLINNESCFKEAVCISAERVYDSCSDKDCIEDARVYFTNANQEKVNGASSVRIKEVSVISTYINLEPIPFNRGFYSVDITFFFDVCLELFTTPAACPTTVHGVSLFSKKVILYGSDGSVKVFTSGENCETGDNFGNKSVPKAIVQVASPIALSADIYEGKKNCCHEACCSIPQNICNAMGGSIDFENCNKTVYATIGLFIIVQLVRNTQMLIPAYDFCIPDKECVTSSDNPCELFKQIDFPVNEFFPQGIENKCSDKT